MNTMKLHIAKQVRRLGYEIVPSWQMERMAFSTHLRKVFTYAGIQCVLDIGANTGQYRDFIRTEVGWEGLIISFEPVE